MTPPDLLTVVKRNTNREPLDLDKIHVMVEEACKGVTGVSASQVEMNSGIQFYDGITTEEIQGILIRSAADLITEENPNYQYVAARLLSISLRKKLYGRNRKPPKLFQHVMAGCKKGIYDSTILRAFNDIEWERLDYYIDYDLDDQFT